MRMFCKQETNNNEIEFIIVQFKGLQWNFVLRPVLFKIHLMWEIKVNRCLYALGKILEIPTLSMTFDRPCVKSTDSKCPESFFIVKLDPFAYQRYATLYLSRIVFFGVSVY